MSYIREGTGVTVIKKYDIIERLIQELGPGKVSKAMRIPTTKAAAYVAANKLRGQALNRRSGRLAQSLVPSVKVGNGVASFGTPLHYGAIHEFELGHSKGHKWLEPGTKEYVESGEFMKLFVEALERELKK